MLSKRQVASMTRNIEKRRALDALAAERDRLREALGAVSVEISSAESYNAKIESIVRAVLEEGGGDG